MNTYWRVNWLNQKISFHKNIIPHLQRIKKQIKKIIIINISIVKQWNKQLNEWNEILEQEKIIQIEDININDQMGFTRYFYK